MSRRLLDLDYPDPDVLRVGEVYYMVTTTMHFCPGGEILRSYDLVNWEWVAFVFDSLEDDTAHRLEDDQNIYGKGMWAASLRHHEGEFYVCFVANETRKTYLYRSRDITGPWTRSLIKGFYHDPSLLFDSGRVYVAWGNTEIRITELDADLSGPRPGGLDRVVVRDVDNPFLGYEGCHFYRIEGRYYLFLIHSRPDRWRRVQACFWAESLDDEFQGGDVFDHDAGYGNNGIAQGGIVDTAEGDWYAMLFQDHGAVGRIPVLVPLVWDGPWPRLGGEVRSPSGTSLASDHRYSPLVGSDDFDSHLGPHWQWNHNPDPCLWRLERGQLRIRTERVVKTVLQARNTLTQRMLFPTCAAEVTVDGTALCPGDRAGLIALQSSYGAIAVVRSPDGWQVQMFHRPDDDPAGVIGGVVQLKEGRVRVRLQAWFSDAGDEAEFSFWNVDGWRVLGPRHRLEFKLDHFVGCRFGLFVASTQNAGGEAGFSKFRYVLSRQFAIANPVVRTSFLARSSDNRSQRS